MCEHHVQFQLRLAESEESAKVAVVPEFCIPNCTAREQVSLQHEG
jgi:hypothetical protein